MKLAVLTLCPQILQEGRWWSYEPFVLEMDAWGRLFDELVMVAPLESGPPPPFWAPYAEATRISVVPYRKDRGRGLEGARTSALEVPRMLSAIVRAAARTDATHVRCPAAIGLLGALLVPVVARRRVAKYAGQWSGYPGEPATFRLQRRLLRSRWWRAPALVYGGRPGDPPWIRPLFTSVLSAGQMAEARVARERTWPNPPRVLFVGRLVAAKNVDALLRALALLEERGLGLQATVVGDGPERPRLERLAAELGLTARVRFAGALSHAAVLDAYREAEVLVLASQTEGWPKAITEAMAHGLVAIGSSHGLVPDLLADGRGLVVPPADVEALASRLESLAQDPAAARAMGRAAAGFAERFTLEGLEAALRTILAEAWTVDSGALHTGGGGSR